MGGIHTRLAIWMRSSDHIVLVDRIQRLRSDLDYGFSQARLRSYYHDVREHYAQHQEGSKKMLFSCASFHHWSLCINCLQLSYVGVKISKIRRGCLVFWPLPNNLVAQTSCATVVADYSHALPTTRRIGSSTQCKNASRSSSHKCALWQSLPYCRKIESSLACFELEDIVVFFAGAFVWLSNIKIWIWLHKRGREGDNRHS